jgi:hypothetical protein
MSDGEAHPRDLAADRRDVTDLPAGRGVTNDVAAAGGAAPASSGLRC